MSLLSLHTVSIAFGGPLLLDAVSLDIEKGQRISFLGRNGAGKSTLMKIVAGLLPPDSGEIITAPGIRVAYLPQDVPESLDGTVYNVVARGAGHVGEHLALLHEAQQLHEHNDEIEKLHHAIEEAHGWPLQVIIDRVLSQTSLDGDTLFNTLSGGMRRRVFMARALVMEPDLLLLDEPTNHLDIASIAWLESFLLSTKVTVLFVTHDRRLLKRLATRIIELDRGKVVDWSCDYTTFLKRKQSVLDAEEREWERFDKKLSQEEVWIRKGIQARRTRNEGRVRALLRMRSERSKRRERSGTVAMAISQADRSGTRVLEAKGLSFYYENRPIVRELDVTVVRGDRVGIIGPNGCGKTTLLNLLLGKTLPQAGTVENGTRVEPVYFDQFRQALDPEKTVWENTAPGGGDMVFVNGESKHVISYLQDFLFTPDRAKSPVKQLSGGERNRLMLARLFTQPSNLLVLDEPTNDLDSETLELLEELLTSYAGTILLVSHDREFLNNVVTSTLVFEGEGYVKEYVGGYDDWERQRERALAAAQTKKTAAALTKERPCTDTKTGKKRSYREEQEFAQLPLQIELWEQEQSNLTELAGDPENYKKEGFALDNSKRLMELEEQIAAAYERWNKLEGKSR